MKTLNNLKTKNVPNWCPGCGDFGIWTAFKQAADKEGWDNSNTVITAGIGCHGHINNFVALSSFEGLHGRALPVASGIKIANPRLKVFVFTGDGDALSEGGNHFIHTARRNHDLTVILHDNAIYGLTTGQTSPRSPKGFISKSTPQGSFEEPLNPLALAITAGATFVARAYSGDIDYLADLMIEADKHKGFAFIDVLQPCVTFNSMYSHFFYQENTYQIEADFDATNKQAAFDKSLEWDLKKIPVGVFYNVDKPTYEEQIVQIDKVKVEKRDIASLYTKYS
ncbi:MAG TPA: 2-oxoacid:ferredoxin oxidoreductase subunit beta [Candidatus Saccharimonadales bacterium]|nr:2-oxoacid:ferredoxin oxidoreductase subunit beta [Candidatus Saccharimonadales bacterium]